MKKTLFTSDTHYFHKNIIRYSERPFLTVDEMNEAMIAGWNSVVGDGDRVFHLGDFAFAKHGDPASILSRLKGYKILIKGNHDYPDDKMLAWGFNEVYNELVVSDDESGMTAYLRHKPELDRRNWKAAYMHFHGHVHNEWRLHGDLINVGVDVWNFTPKTFKELIHAV